MAPAPARRVVRPGHRLTGLGTGVVTTAITIAGGGADALLSGSPGILFGLVFLLASAAGALWVRPGDLAAAPISAPIAFAVALALTGTTGGGLLAYVMSMVTGLATRASWLYCGTLLSAAIAGVRRLSRRPPARG